MSNISVIFVKNPFNPLSSRVVREVEFTGDSVSAYVQSEIARFFPLAPPDMEIAVGLNGQVLSPDDASSTIPLAGDTVSLCVVPTGGGGGGGKDVVRMVAMLAVMVVATVVTMGVGSVLSGGAFIGSGMVSATGWAAVGGAMAGAVTMAVGGMIVNAVLPPVVPDLPGGGFGSNSFKDSPSYGWESGGNPLSEGGALPVLYGKCKVTPYLIGRYVSLNGSDSYLNLLFALADHYIDSISNIQINGQPIDNFSNVEHQFRNGDETQAVIEWFNRTYFDTAVGKKITSSGTFTEQSVNQILTLGTPVTASTADNISSFSVEITFKGLSVLLYSGYGENAYDFYGPGRASVLVEWRKDMDGWSGRRYEISKRSEQPFTETFRIAGITSGQYEVRFSLVDLHDETTGQDVTWTKLVTSPFESVIAQTCGNSVTRLGIGLAAPSGLFYANDAGGLDLVTLTIRIDFRMVGAELWTTEYADIGGATRYPVRHFHEIFDLPPGKYEVRLSYNTPPPTGNRYASEVWFDFLQESLDDCFTYPRTALLGMRIKATDQLSGGLPRVDCIAHRCNVMVNGVAKPANIPAWASYNMLMHTRYGGGVPESRLNVSEFEAWAEFTSARNIESNIIFDSSMSLPQAMAMIGAVGRGQVIQRGTRFGCLVDAPASAVQLFTVGNISAGSFSEVFMDSANRANCIEISYFDAEKDYTRQTVEVRDKYYDSEDEEINKTTVTLHACTNRDSAVRHARFLLNCNRWLKRTVRFSADVDAVACQIGDVIRVQHDCVRWTVGGRILSADANSVTLDREISFFEPGQNYRMWLRHEDDTLEQHYLSSIDGDDSRRVILSDTWFKLPSSGAVYSLGVSERLGRKYRVLSISKSGDLQCQITALEHYNNIYDDMLMIAEFYLQTETGDTVVNEDELPVRLTVQVPLQTPVW